MDFKSRPQKPRSIDGFMKGAASHPTNVRRPQLISGTARSQPTSPRRAIPVRQTTQNTPVDERPLQRPTTVNNGQSFIGTTLPNPDFNRQFDEPTTEKPKRKGLHFRKQRNAMKPKRKGSIKRKLIAAGVVVVVGAVGAFSYLTYNVNKVFHCGITCAVQAINSIPLKSQGDWVNTLVAGYDPSDGDITTDTIMVVSANKVTGQAFMLSIPRDMWVNNLPGFGHQKINASNDIASFSAPGYPNGGMGEMEQQVHDKLGITSDYFILVNNQAYVDAVNAVGGVDVNIQSENPKGLYDPNVDKVNGGPVKFSNGWQHLDGLQALGLVKARGDSPLEYGFPNGDFDREAHQRQVMIALKTKAESSGVLANPLAISNLFNAVSKNVQTDVSIQDIQGFSELMNKVNTNNIKSASVQSINGVKLLTGQVVQNLDVEAPSAGIDNYSQIQAFIQNLYSSNPVAQEGATVAVLNGSNVDGLANTEATKLQSSGFDVAGTGDPNSVYSSSLIIDQSNGKDRAARQELQKLFPNTPIATSTTTPAEATEAQAYPNATFVVVLGQNWDSASTGQ